jgi:ABC-type transporter Mla MlaB component
MERINPGERMNPEPARLRYYMYDGSSAFRFKLSGPLRGQDALEVEQCWRTALSAIGGRAFVVDLSELTTVDDAGRELLDLWRRHGARFVAKSEQPRPPAPWIMEHSFRFFRVAAVPVAVLLSLLLPSAIFGADERWQKSSPSIFSHCSNHR